MNFVKKQTVLLSAALLALAGCAKLDIESTPDILVTFQAANYVPQTKAGEVSVFNDFATFRCRGFMHAEGIDLNSDGSIITEGTGKPSYQEFFGASGETISPFNSSDNVIENPTASTDGVAYWAPSHNYYWPKSHVSYVNFAAWYGTNGSSAVDPTVTYAYDNTTSKWTATMAWSYTTTENNAGTNFLYADMAWRFTENPTTGYKFNGLSSSYQGVPMLFHHALAQINVKAYAYSSTLSLTAGTDQITESLATAGGGTTTCTRVITLENIAITPVHKTGTLTLTNADPGADPTNGYSTQAWSGGWTGTDATPSSLTVSNKIVDQISQATAEDVFAATCVVPQTLQSSAALTFTLHIVTTYANGVTHEEKIPQTIKLGTDGFGTTAWEQNHKYTYYLKIIPAEGTVRFDPALDSDWITTGGGEKTL